MFLALTCFHIAIIFIAAASFVAAAVSDVLSYRIPNYLSGILLILFYLYVVTSPISISWFPNLLVFTAVGLTGFALFAKGLIGAGDIKLLSVASLWAGPSLVGTLLLMTAFMGGIEALFVAIMLYFKLPKPKAFSHVAKAPVPYGVAVASGGVTMLSLLAQPVLSAY